MYYLLLAAALMTSVSGYIRLNEVDYKRLQDKDGVETLASSTQNSLAFDDLYDILYIVAKEPRRLTTYFVERNGNLISVTNHTFSENDGEPTDVEYCNPGNVADARVAISFNIPGREGTVQFYKPVSRTNVLLEASELTAAVGVQPVDIKFNRDCSMLLVVNTARPVANGSVVSDNDGTITKLSRNLSWEPEDLTTETFTFGDYLDQNKLDELARKNFRWSPKRDHNDVPLAATRNMEPVNVEFSLDEQTAYVAMPKNNAIARLDLNSGEVKDIIPQGKRSWASFYLDASKSDYAVHMENYRIFSLMQPVQVKALEQDGSEWLVSLDSGFLDNIPEYGYQDHADAYSLMISDVIVGVDTELRSKLLDFTRLGEARVSTEDGLSSNGLTIEEVTLFGGRGISIHESHSLNISTALVDNIERVSAQFYKDVFNTAFGSPFNTPQQDRELTSSSVGPNLSVMETAVFEGQKVLFLGSGTSGMIYVYVLVPDANCPQPFFHSVHRSGGIFRTWQGLFNDNDAGDLGITDMLYIGNSMDHDALLFVASATGNSLSVYMIDDAPAGL